MRSIDWRERTVAPGELLVTGLNLFDPRPEILDALLLAYSRLGEAGLGPGRARLAFTEVRQPGGGGAPQLTTLSLAPLEGAPSRVMARFVTPTEIKVRGEIARDATFEPLFGRLFERLRFLIRTYGGSDVEVGGILDAAKRVATTRQDLRPAGGVTRYSTRTGQTHSLTGFVGEAIYEGDFTLLWPWLKASEWTGIGRQTVWGKGQIVAESMHR